MCVGVGVVCLCVGVVCLWGLIRRVDTLSVLHDSMIV